MRRVACRPAALFTAAAWCAAPRTGTRPCTADILECEIEVMGDDDGVEATQAFDDVTAVDSFSKAKVTNFFKRHGNAGAIEFDTRSVRMGDVTHFHARLKLPLPDQYGERHGEGVAETERDAEMLALMHGERVIDTLGFQLYGLKSSQQRHCDAAKASGRWAPGPADTPKEPTTKSPPPLRMVSAAGSDGGASSTANDEINYTHAVKPPPSFAPLALTLASPKIVDESSVKRVRRFLAQYNVRLEQSAVLKRLHQLGAEKIANSFIATIVLPLPQEFGRREAVGKGPNRKLAVVLACMHAELIIDAVGGELHHDPSCQQQHVEECMNVGRWATEPRAMHPDRWSKPSPPPIAFAADGTADLADLPQAPTIVNIITTSVVDRTASDRIALYLGITSPNFLVQELGATSRASLVLPIPNSSPRLAIGVADTIVDAEDAAAMHALQILGALNIPVYADAAKQREFRKEMLSVGALAADIDAPTPSDFSAIPSPPPFKILADAEKAGRMKVSFTRAQMLQEKAQLRNLRSLGVNTDDDNVLESARERTSPDVWQLEADSTDGFIIIHPTLASGSTKSLNHTLYSPRTLDTLARVRFLDYLERNGVSRKTALTTVKVQSLDHGFMYRCKVPVPVPPQFGERYALGEAYSEREAEVACSMHAELILDTLGLPFYDHAVLQRRHAEAARRLGRYAPLPFEEHQPETLPSPPPLRHEKADSLRWLRYVQKKKGAAASVVEPLREANRRFAEEDLISIRVDEIDSLVNLRVAQFLSRHNKSVGGDVEISQEGPIKHAVFKAQITVPVPAEYGERIAVGVSNRRGEAVTLCLMHLERIVNALGLHMHDDYAMQLRHHKIAKQHGQDAPHPQDAPKAFDTPSPPGLRNVIGMKLPPPPPPPTDDELARDDGVLWNRYVRRVMHRLEVKGQNEAVQAATEGRGPRQHDPVTDTLLTEVENAPINASALLDLRAACTTAHLEIPQLRWQSVGRGSGAEQKFLVRHPAVPFPVDAVGMGSTGKEAIFRAAMHYTAMLKLGIPKRTQPATSDADRAPPADDRFRSGDLLRFFARLTGNDPPVVQVRQSTLPDGKTRIFRASANVTAPNTGILLGRGEASTASAAERLAEDDLYTKLRDRSVMVAIDDFRRRYPNAGLANIVQVPVINFPRANPKQGLSVEHPTPAATPPVPLETWRVLARPRAARADARAMAKDPLDALHKLASSAAEPAVAENSLWPALAAFVATGEVIASVPSATPHDAAPILQLVQKTATPGVRVLYVGATVARAAAIAAKAAISPGRTEAVAASDLDVHTVGALVEAFTRQPSILVLDGTVHPAMLGYVMDVVGEARARAAPSSLHVVWLGSLAAPQGLNTAATPLELPPTHCHDAPRTLTMHVDDLQGGPEDLPKIAARAKDGLARRPGRANVVVVCCDSPEMCKGVAEGLPRAVAHFNAPTKVMSAPDVARIRAAIREADHALETNPAARIVLVAGPEARAVIDVLPASAVVDAAPSYTRHAVLKPRDLEARAAAQLLSGATMEQIEPSAQLRNALVHSLELHGVACRDDDGVVRPLSLARHVVATELPLVEAKLFVAGLVCRCARLAARTIRLAGGSECDGLLRRTTARFGAVADVDSDALHMTAFLVAFAASHTLEVAAGENGEPMLTVQWDGRAIAIPPHVAVACVPDATVTFEPELWVAVVQRRFMVSMNTGQFYRMLPMRALMALLFADGAPSEKASWIVSALSGTGAEQQGDGE